jgi:hypothetical protein
MLKKNVDVMRKLDYLKIRKRREIVIAPRSKEYCYNDYHDRRVNGGYVRMVNGNFYNR